MVTHYTRIYTYTYAYTRARFSKLQANNNNLTSKCLHSIFIFFLFFVFSFFVS